MRRRHYYEYDDELPLSRDPIRGKIGGVCAGIARRFGFSTGVVRLTAIIGLFVAPHVVIFGYILLWMILDEYI